MTPIFKQLHAEGPEGHGYTLIEVRDNQTREVAGFALLVLPEHEVQAKAACELIAGARRAASV